MKYFQLIIECPRPDDWPCNEGKGDVFKKVDCDGDGYLDLTCASGRNLWLILSSEGCPKSNSFPEDQPITKCEALAGIISMPNTVASISTMA